MIIEERVDRLEEMMAKTQEEVQKTNLIVQGLVFSVNRFKDEMKEFKDEMKEFKDEMKEFKDEVELDRKKMNKKWGELANKWGTIVEDLVLPNITTIAEEYFGCKEEDCEDFMFRRKKKAKGKEKKEFDIIAVYPDKVVFNETKATPGQDYIDKFIKELPLFFEYFPELKGKELIPVFASLYIPQDRLKYLSKNKIYAMGMKDDLMDILNPEISK